MHVARGQQAASAYLACLPGLLKQRSAFEACFQHLFRHTQRCAKTSWQGPVGHPKGQLQGGWRLVWCACAACLHMQMMSFAVYLCGMPVHVNCTLHGICLRSTLTPGNDALRNMFECARKRCWQSLYTCVHLMHAQLARAMSMRGMLAHQHLSGERPCPLATSGHAYLALRHVHQHQHRGAAHNTTSTTTTTTTTTNTAPTPIW